MIVTFGTEDIKQMERDITAFKHKALPFATQIRWTLQRSQRKKKLAIKGVDAQMVIIKRFTF